MSTMTETTPRPSATIIQFPLRGRPLSSDKGNEARLDTAPRVAITGWYHDEAIEEARRAGS